jgi:HK97 family phage prohead protease
MTAMQRLFGGGAVETLGPREVGVIMATRGIKRDGNDVVPGGIDYTNFLRCPTILWQHDPSSPVGVCTALALINNELRARIMFAPEFASALADQCYSLVRAGVINACSIGFDVRASQPIDKAKPRGGQLITRCELIECSFVSCPADPDALVVERAVQGDIARFASLQRVPEAAIQRAFAQMPRRSDGQILSHAGHVWALLKAHEIDHDAVHSYAARRAEIERLRQVGRRHHH